MRLQMMQCSLTLKQVQHDLGSEHNDFAAST